MAARILVVEDNPTQAKIIGLLLKDHYRVSLATSGESCLMQLAEENFDVVLLDVNLPSMNGYDVCRRIKANPETAHIPVIFISVNFTNEDRLHGFDAGGFDYLAKPVVKEELLKKIAMLLAHEEERRRLQSTTDYAVNTAMTAMTSAAEQGLVLQFMKASFGCKSHQDLARAILNAVAQFGLEGIVQIRGDYAVISRSPGGACTPLEESVLANVSKAGRIVDLKRRTAINYARVSLIVKNMPLEEEDRYGRLKDHLNMLLEGADARSMALDMDTYLAAEARRLLGVIREISDTLMDVNRRSHELHTNYGTVFSAMVQDLESTIPLLELNHSQEEMLDDLVKRASDAYVSLGGQEGQVEKELLAAMETLNRLAPGGSHGKGAIR